MAPKKRGSLSTAAVDVADSSSMADGQSEVVGGGGDEEANTTTALPSGRPISFVTKQQKDAASGADGIDQYELARTQVTKVAKSAVGENVQLRKEVILGLIKSSTVFINYLSSVALEKTHEAGNKTLSATHVINAFKEMGFPEEYTSQLRREYNEKAKAEADRTKANKAAKADAARAADQQSMEMADESRTGPTEDGESRQVEDESMAVDLSKEGGEEEEEGEEDGEQDEEEEDDEAGVEDEMGGLEGDEEGGEGEGGGDEEGAEGGSPSQEQQRDAEMAA